MGLDLSVGQFHIEISDQFSKRRFLDAPVSASLPRVFYSHGIEKVITGGVLHKLRL